MPTAETRSFQGWRMLGLATAALVLTTPGQTIGISSFTDHMIEDLGVTRSALSAAYMIATLTASTAMPMVGRWVDRRGVSHAMTRVGIVFVIAIASTGFATNIWMIGLSFVGLRMMGQGSLSLIGDTTISLWFQERRGRAFAIAMTVSNGLMSLSPLVFTALIAAFGWRNVWWITAAFIACTVVPIGRFLLIDRPEAIGQVPDGATGEKAEAFVPQYSFEVREASRTAGFWSLLALTCLASALSTALTFHNLSVMKAGGLSEAEAAAVFVPITVGAVGAGFVIGWLTDHVPARLLVSFTAGSFAMAALLAIVVAPGWAAVAYGLAIGVAGGSTRAVTGAMFPKWFGTANIGAIRGLVTTASVAASAVGPLLLSVGNDLSNGYGPALVIAATISVGIAATTLFVADPQPRQMT